MNTVQAIKRVASAAALSSLLFAGSSANAALVTQLIHFDDATNGWKWYSDVDRNFLFTPTNLASGQCADSTDGGNGSCVHEGPGQNGLAPLMTRPTNGSTLQGSSNQPPDASGDLLKFTLDSFYFFLDGNGTGAENAISVKGSNLASYTFQVGGNYDLLGAPDVTFYSGANAGGLAGDLMKNTGYIVSFGDLFKDVTWIEFYAPASANSRLDCVVATFDGTTTEPKSSFKGGCGGGSEVAEPGTVALLGLGVLGLVGMARRRKLS
jgi:hypothetical protein